MKIIATSIILIIGALVLTANLMHTDEYPKSFKQKDSK